MSTIYCIKRLGPGQAVYQFGNEFLLCASIILAKPFDIYTQAHTITRVWRCNEEGATTSRAFTDVWSSSHRVAIGQARDIIGDPEVVFSV